MLHLIIILCFKFSIISLNKLIQRNKTLLQMLDAKNVSNREVEKLRLAIDKDYVELFWIGHQG